MVSKWIDCSQIDWENDKIKSIHVDTTNFTAIVDIGFCTENYILEQQAEYLYSKEEVKNIIEKFHSLSLDGNKKRKLLNWGCPFGVNLKYIRAYKVCHSWILCSRYDKLEKKSFWEKIYQSYRPAK